MSRTLQHPSELDSELVRIGATISQMRQMRGMTQEQLANRALLSRPYVANVEAGRAKPSTKAIARIADALVVPQISLIATSADDAA